VSGVAQPSEPQRSEPQSSTVQREPLRRLPRSAFFVDTAVMTQRNLVRLLRTPQLLFFATVQPVMFVLLFTYVFGGSIRVPGTSYIDYLLPGIFVQTVAFGGVNTAVGLASDLGTGIVDRFRSLPMARSAVLAGRTIADAVRNLFVVLLMIIVGSFVGFRFHNGFAPAVGAVALALLFGFSLAWLFAFIGMTLKDTETAQVAGLVVIFPLTFVSGAFSPISTMPWWLGGGARNQPFTYMVDAMRGLTQGGPVGHSVIMAVVWMIGITVVFSTLAVRRYRQG
jgi:ABC transporter DrrB family efflux protein